MKKIKALALSDLHLGEPEGLLYNSNDEFNLIDIMINKISELSKGDGVFDSGIEQLILIGDIVELPEATDEEAYANTKFFLTSLLDKVKIDKIIYIPGNHDHHLWVELLKIEHGKNDYRDCSPKTQIDSSLSEKSFFIERCLPNNYPSEKVEIKYPNYRFETENAYYFFDHGHLFSKTMEKFTDAENAESLEDLEERTYGFMENIWYETKNRLREIVYDWFRKLKLSFGQSTRGTTFEEDCTPLLDDYIRVKVIWYLKRMCGIKNEVKKDFHFIFGHTHNGGRILRGDRKVRVNGRFISLWNTGGWLAPSKIFSPDAYIFYLEQSKDKTHPNLYKLVGREKLEDEGDYPKKILRERVRYIC